MERVACVLCGNRRRGGGAWCMQQLPWGRGGVAAWRCSDPSKQRPRNVCAHTQTSKLRHPPRAPHNASPAEKGPRLSATSECSASGAGLARVCRRTRLQVAALTGKKYDQPRIVSESERGYAGRRGQDFGGAQLCRPGARHTQAARRAWHGSEQQAGTVAGLRRAPGGRGAVLPPPAARHCAARRWPGTCAARAGASGSQAPRLCQAPHHRVRVLLSVRPNTALIWTPCGAHGGQKKSKKPES